MRTVLYWATGAFLVGLLALAGCGTPRETVVVSERPPAPTDTATLSVDTLANVVPIPTGYDTVQARRFDRGKLWTFDQVPVDYYQSTYGVEADEQWLSKARKAALRFGEGCSASFVSPNGLVMTNHHCAREWVSKVSRNGEHILETGFYADSLSDERRAMDLHVDQLVKTEDVTGQVTRGLPASGDTRGGGRQRRVEALEEKMTQEAQQKDDQLRVEIVDLYHGAKYSAYTYRRYEDVRLVMVPELQLGFFGGKSDNFTYPRFTLDVAFFRVYGKEGTPLQTESYFSWDSGGAEEGEPVFVVGNPGSTSRLAMVSQLQYKRDYQLPNRLEVFRSRGELLRSYIVNNPEKATTYNLRNTYFSVENSIKSIEGKLQGLQDPYLLARRAKSIRALQDTIASIDSLRQYNRVIGEVKRLQESKRILADKERAFLTFSNLELGSRILSRAVYGYYYDFLRTRGARPERVQDIRSDAERIEDWPAELERSFITSQLTDIREAYGPNHPTIQRLLGSRSPESLATELVEESALLDSTKYVKLLDEGYLKSEDASVPVIEALAPLFLNVTRQMEDLRSTEENLNRRLSKARLAVYGSSVPSDATFTLRISDGRVRGYSHNGADAPPYTNFYGLYDRYYSHNQDDWMLPERWVSPPDSFDLETPLNIVSTNDISGGNSGSPLLNEDLQVVGVVFDSNMEALPNEYLYRTRSARAISVDARGILEALSDMYGASRLVQEITTGNLPSTATPTATSSK